MGHSLVVDYRGNLWLFGGYSLSRGPLNDIQSFDTANNTWVQVVLKVHPGAKPPPKRYFHASAYVNNRREMYVYGGMNDTYFLNDFWKFSTDSESWTEIKHHSELPPLAGHTLTYYGDADYQSLVLIGGISTTYGFLESVWEFKLSRHNGESKWLKVPTNGTIPVGIFGHSTVYHEKTQSFYVYGGYSFKADKVDHFADLYALDYQHKVWSVLPPDRKINHNPASLPAPRTFHSAVTSEDYMVLIGGNIIEKRDPSQVLLVYSYKCNMWIPLNKKFITLAGHELEPLIGVSSVIYDSKIYVFGGYLGTLHGSMIEIDIPIDLCTLNANKQQCTDRIGCANCVVYDKEGTNTSYCHSHTRSQPEKCLNPNGNTSAVAGVKCDDKLLLQRECYKLNSCTECLAKWPAHPNSKQHCQWCSNCPKGKCIPQDGDCADENECKGQLQDNSVIREADKCKDRYCVASDCIKCNNLGPCFWTRQVQRSSEERYAVNPTPIYNWNCVKEEVHSHSSLIVKSSPPSECPESCISHTTCQTCLFIPGAEGGWQQCYWSTLLKECLSPSYVPLRCLGGTCGQLLTGGRDVCPPPCSSYSQCNHCLSQSHCGWCVIDTEVGGKGFCIEGRLEGPYNTTCKEIRDINLNANNSIINQHRMRHGSTRLIPSELDAIAGASTSWHYDVCPPENECANGHHTCDNKSQVCKDKLIGFECVCASGYNMTESGICAPVCNQGCIHGICIEPNNCSCNFGFVGENCSIECNCNGHSNCAGPDKLDVCLKCHNNTMGSQCQKCKPLFVGDPKKNEKCISCFDYCYKHTDKCFTKAVAMNITKELGLTEDIKMEYLSEYIKQLPQLVGAKTNAYCVGCRNNTTGTRCDDCEPGHFRGSTHLHLPCKECRCNGHGTVCDAVFGNDCDCGNNTDTPCDGKSRGGGGAGGGAVGSPNDKDEDKDCWQKQCSKCKENYLGSPSDGHQCYLTMKVDEEYCLDPSTQAQCDSKPSPLLKGQTVYFAVQPKFMNVDIRLIIDITEGGADVYFGTKDDAYVVELNRTDWKHYVKIDSKYPVIADDQHNLRKLANMHKLRRNYVGVGFDLLGTFAHNIDTRRDLHPTDESPSSEPPQYHLTDRPARGLKTFVTVSSADNLLIVRNVTDRLVITLPHGHSHDLRMAKFYVIVRGVGGKNSESATGAGLDRHDHTYGSIFFRQDQPRIDLFVFFSVFFSCFFLFLAVCVVVWKLKQSLDHRRARRRHVVEMLHMAKRPFAATTLVLHPSQNSDSATDDPHLQSGDNTLWSPGRRKKASGGGGGGSKKDRWWSSAEGSEMALIALEPTDDDVAAVVTVMVQLPGGDSNEGGEDGGPPHRLALGSALCLMARIYPPPPRPFHLRRRASHNAT